MIEKIAPIAKKISSSRLFKIAATIAIAGLVLLVLPAIIFVSSCGSAQSNFHPVNDPASAELQKIESSIPGYVRTEETTYLTYPEWYLVFNPQEYGSFLAHNKPSHFPYFGSIGQFWSGYCQVYGITKKHYPFNAGDHLVEAVIGTSFTVEYAAKGIYENTVGRISEFFAGDKQTQEDIYAAKIAQEYGAFVPTDPWYAFPFVKAFVGVWKDTDFWGPHMARKIERKFFLSAEYGVKAIYAKIIGFGTHATYGIADTEIYAHASGNAAVLDNPKVRKVRELADHSFIITVPHYQGFTDTVPSLAQQGLAFSDVAGSDEMLMTVVAPKDWKYDLQAGSELFSMPIIIDSAFKRVAIQVPIKSMSSMLEQLRSEHILVEHLFDY
ncbi:MAG: dehydrogenase [Candidatus Taylorbacteria bacterium]|nr:dehydrogenase [Candidatus Taylorbacteria bacterium]